MLSNDNPSIYIVTFFNKLQVDGTLGALTSLTTFSIKDFALLVTISLKKGLEEI